MGGVHTGCLGSGMERMRELRDGEGRCLGDLSVVCILAWLWVGSWVGGGGGVRGTDGGSGTVFV
jgi:hypothetical protein